MQLEKNAKILRIRYENWRGEISERRIRPVGMVAWATTVHHPVPTWILPAFDEDKQDYRDFDLLKTTILGVEE